MVWCGLLHLTFLDDVTYACTNKWHKKNKKNRNKKVTFHILTYGTMRGCRFTSLVICINDKIRDIREGNVTIRNDICTNIGYWLLFVTGYL